MSVCFLTFELDLQDLIHIVVDVTIGVEGVAWAVHADLQPQVGSLEETNHIKEEKHMNVIISKKRPPLSLRRKVLIDHLKAQQE